MAISLHHNYRPPWVPHPDLQAVNHFNLLAQKQRWGVDLQTQKIYNFKKILVLSLIQINR